MSETSTVPDHCRLFALSDPKEVNFQVQCDHHHDDSCDRCDQLTSALCEIESALITQTDNMLPGVGDELKFTVKNAKANILAWKAHILRSINQDAARVDVLESLDESSVLIVQDWAMKYLPRKYRESETDWFGKRGIPWHTSVAFRKVSDQLQMLTFAHIPDMQSGQLCGPRGDGGRHKAAQDHHAWLEYSQLPTRQRWLLSLWDHHYLRKRIRSRAGCGYQTTGFLRSPGWERGL